jgi:hypothetical protein
MIRGVSSAAVLGAGLVLAAGDLGCTSASPATVDAGGTPPADAEVDRDAGGLAGDAGDLAGEANAGPCSSNRTGFPWWDAGRLVADAGVTDIALGPDSIYWIAGDEVLSAPRDGGDPVVLLTGQASPGALALDSRFLYVANAGTLQDSGAGGPPGQDGTIVAVPLDGGSPRTLAAAQNAPGALAVDDVNVYFAAGAPPQADGGPGFQILSVPISGGAPSVLVPSVSPVPVPTYAPQVSPVSIAAYGGTVAFGDGYVLRSIPRSGGTSTALATTPRGMTSIALGPTSAYWAEADIMGEDYGPPVTGESIRSVPLAGGTSVTISDCEAPLRKLVLVDGTLFWVSTSRFEFVDGYLESTPVGGGATHVEIWPFTGPLAVDATGIAWIDVGGVHFAPR